MEVIVGDYSDKSIFGNPQYFYFFYTLETISYHIVWSALAFLITP